MKKHRPVRNMALVVMLISMCSGAHAQSQGSFYSGPLEYSIPLLKAMPPIDSSMPSDVTNAYLWADQLLRTTPMASIDKYIGNIGFNDTLKYLAKTVYRVDDYNPLKLYQWGISGWPLAGHSDYPWHYKADPDHERLALENHIGATYSDTGRTGYLLACDIIADVTIVDTAISHNPSNSIVPDLVFVHSKVNDEIKGQLIPNCSTPNKVWKGGRMPLASTIVPGVPDSATIGSCLNFEYSPEWQKGIFNDAPPPDSFLSDSTGWWVRPNGEYIVFLYIAGVNGDTTNGYFTIKPLWGVFGTQGAMYHVSNGIVQDPNDDFGLGASNGLTVADWKARLRARIYNILNP